MKFWKKLIPFVASSMTLSGMTIGAPVVSQVTGLPVVQTALAAATTNVITISGTGFATHGVTVDIGSSTGLTPTSTPTVSSIKLTKPAKPVGGPSSVDVVVHSGGFSTTLKDGYAWGSTVKSAKQGTGKSSNVITISGTGFATHGVTVDIGSSTGLTPTSTPTATSIKVATPTKPGSGSSAVDVVVHSGGFDATLKDGFAWAATVKSAR
jgi:hypothetical protein